MKIYEKKVDFLIKFLPSRFAIFTQKNIILTVNSQDFSNLCDFPH